MKLDDLPEIEEGDYGWCLHDPLDSSPAHLVWYDDDEYWCSHGNDERNEDHECSGDACFLDSGAIVYRNGDVTGDYDVVPFGCLSQISVSLDAHYPSTRKGWVYAIALTPERDLRRLKVGFTTRPASERLKSFRTTNPIALLLGLWDADAHMEGIAHGALRGRIGKSEVFEVPDLEEAFAAITRAIAGAQTL